MSTDTTADTEPGVTDGATPPAVPPEPEAERADSAEVSEPAEGSERTDRPTSERARGKRHHGGRKSARNEPVEVIDFLATARRHWLLLLGVPVLAAALTIGYVLLTPVVWTATATVSAPALVGGQFGAQYSGSQAINQYVAQFQSIATGPTVRKEVTRTVKIAPSDMVDGLSVDPVGASSMMTITYESTDLTTVEPVIKEVASSTLDMLFGQQVSLAEAVVSNAMTAVNDATAAIAKWEATQGIIAPEDVYRERLAQMSSLEEQAVMLTIQGNTAGAAAARSGAAAIKTDLKRFAPLLGEYRSLVSARDAAASSLSSAQQALQSAQAQRLAADPAKVVFTTDVAAADRMDTLFRLVPPITGAGVFLAVVLVMIIEMATASRRGSGRRRGGRS